MKTNSSFRARLPVCLLLTMGAAALPAVAVDAPLQPSESRLAQTPVNARVLYVNPALGTDAPGGGANQRAPLRTITYALQQAQPGTVIQLAAGSYTRDTGEVFPLTIGQNISLRGDEANKGQTVLIVGSGSYVSPTFASQNVTIRALEGSEVRGVTVTNPNTRGTGIWVEEDNPAIRNNTFSNSLREGVFVSGTATPTIQGNVFTGNSGNGISVARSAAGEVRNNVFQNTGFGIVIGGNATPLVQDNQVVSNIDGIVVSNSAQPILRSNVVENNSRDGIVVVGTGLPNLGTADSPGNNIVRNNGRYDLFNSTRQNTVVAIGNQIDPSRISGAVEFVASVGNSRFTDVPGNWAEAYITALAERGVISGFPDGTFRPNEPVTRAQFAAIVNKAFSPSPKRSGVNFVDVSNTFWGRQAIQTAYRGGFLAGYPGQVFQPNQRIPRVQVLVSLSSGLEYGSGTVTDLSRFQDAEDIPTWARGSIAAAVQRNIVVNYPTVGQLAPNREATRAEVAAFVYQALVSAGQAEAIPSPYVVR